ncbi:O-antigen ligase family protein [Anaeromyxobacter terrae]|uniref:O-antigen ligase family protein n=1 Tax=Anaeromyxobacter terrae TaxID=2925406 RepID=UPI001F59656A|nr:O-antigen ligase family protein [Anaeromyxobacter sp. SG22]
MEADVGVVEGGRQSGRALVRELSVRVGWVGLAVYAASLPISIAGMQIGLGVALAALVALRLAGRRVWVRTPVNAPVALVVGAAVASIALAWGVGLPPASVNAALFWRGLVAPLVVAFSLEATLDGDDAAAPRRRALALVLLWSAAAIVPALVAWAQVRTGFDPLHALGLRDVPRRAPAPGDPTHFAAIGFFSWYPRFAHAMTPVAALSLALALFAPLRLRTRVFLGAAGVAAAAAVVLTTSRSAWAGLAVGALTLALLAGRRLARVAVPIAVACSIVAALASPVLRNRLASAFEANVNQDRATIWRVCGAVVRDHPLTGVGFGALPDRSYAYYERFAPAWKMRAWCHDTFFTAWAEGGPLLAFAFVAWWILLARAFLGFRRTGDALGRAASLGVLAALAALFVNALVHDLFWATEPVYALGLLLGAGVVIARPRPG